MRATGPSGRALTHQPALDGIRGAAVLAVLLFHGGHLTGGYLGVDVFFVLSGFLITSLLLVEHRATGAVSLRAFWARRARRLLPALGMALLGVAVYAAFVARPQELADIRGDALATIAYVANWREILTSSDYWALFRAPSPLQHTWSLAIEEQFYLLWPLAFVAATRAIRDEGVADASSRVLRLALALAAASFVLAQVLYDPDSTARVYYGTDTRIASILLGAALGAWAVSHPPVQGRARRRALEAAGLLGVVLLVAANVGLDGESTLLYRGGLLVCALATLAVIAAGVHPERGPVARLFSWRPLRALGLISYGAYLWHWPVYVYLDEVRTGLDGWPLLLVRIGVTLVIATASYHVVERPIRHGAGTPRLMLRLAPVAALALAVTVVAATAGAPSSRAATGDGTRRGGIAVLGDSVARTLYPGIDRAGLPASEHSLVGCRMVEGEVVLPPKSAEVFGDLLVDCPWREEWRRVIRESDPEVVLLVIGMLDLFDLRPHGSDEVLAPGDEEWDRMLDEALDEAFTILGSGGARVVVPNHPCVGVLPGAESAADTTANPERIQAWNDVLARVAARHPDVVVPDLFGFLCPEGRYQREVHGAEPRREDGTHFNDEGADLVAAWLAPLLTAPPVPSP